MKNKHINLKKYWQQELIMLYLPERGSDNMLIDYEVWDRDWETQEKKKDLAKP